MRATAVRCCCDRVHTARTSCPACACVATQWQLVSAHELGDELCLVSDVRSPGQQRVLIHAVLAPFTSVQPSLFCLCAGSPLTVWVRSDAHTAMNHHNIDSVSELPRERVLCAVLGTVHDTVQYTVTLYTRRASGDRA